MLETVASDDAVRIVVNGEDRRVAPGATVADVVATLVDTPAGVAVARNREVVPRSAWAVTLLAAADRVEVVTAAAGG
jgi:sulfur carrier protein